MRDTTIIDCIVDDTTTTVTTIAMVAIVTAVDADSDEQNANATIKKKSNRVATDERGKHREGDDRRATTSKKTWVRRDERQRNEKSGRDDRERCLRDKAHAIDNQWTSSDDESRINDEKMVASKEEKSEDEDEDNFAMAMAPPAKKAKTTRCVVSQKPRKVVESDDDFDAFLAETASLLGDRGDDPLAI
jgi:hypothetical protein